MDGKVIGGRFVLERLLGRGGMSEVWLARDRELDRSVALKLLAGDADPARLVREARAIAALSHPNIAGVYDVGETEGRPYLVLEYLPGGTLDDRLEDGRPLPDRPTARVARDVAAGLAHAHAAGIVHRDLKPSNVLFDREGRAKIADFGIAHTAGQATLTEAGTVLGTAAYLAPEQASGGPVGPRADVYSFGVILFRLLTGRLPFTGATPLEVALKHQRERPPSIRSLRPDAPAGLAALAGQALAKSPGERPADGSELLALLDRTARAEAAGVTAATVRLPAAAAETETVVMPRRPPTSGPPRRSGGRRRALLVFALLGALVAAGIVAAVLVTSGGDSTAPTLPVRTTARDTTTSGATTAPTTAASTPGTTATTAPATTTQPTTTAPPTTGTTAPGTTAAGTTATTPATVTVTTGP